MESRRDAYSSASIRVRKKCFNLAADGEPQRRPEHRHLAAAGAHASIWLRMESRRDVPSTVTSPRPELTLQFGCGWRAAETRAFAQAEASGLRCFNLAADGEPQRRGRRCLRWGGD